VINVGCVISPEPDGCPYGGAHVQPDGLPHGLPHVVADRGAHGSPDPGPYERTCLRGLSMKDTLRPHTMSPVRQSPTATPTEEPTAAPTAAPTEEPTAVSRT
jgi:hypothetical protein